MIDITGCVYGRLRVLRRAPNSTYGQVAWLCRCLCGKQTEIVSYSLRHGLTQSCGCLHRERTKAANTTHGHTRGRSYTVEFSTWQAMHQRCNSNRPKWKRSYKDRGITVCKRWSGPKGFALFLADMGPRPGPKMSIDRKNNDRGYMPSNCRWATVIEQANNRGARGSRLTGE